MFFWEQSFVSIFFIRIIMSSKVCVCVSVIKNFEAHLFCSFGFLVKRVGWGCVICKARFSGGRVGEGFIGVKIESVVLKRFWALIPKTFFVHFSVVTNSAQLIILM